MTTKYSNIKGYPGYYISKRGILFTSLKRVGVKGKGQGRKGTTHVISFKGSNYIHTFSDKEREFIMKDYKENGFSIKKISLKYGYSRYFIHQVLKGIR